MPPRVCAPAFPDVNLVTNRGVSVTDLWPRLEPLLASAERPARYLNHEFGCVYKPEADFRFCMMYPDTYELGQANQALRILVNVVNAVDGMVAERAGLAAGMMTNIVPCVGLVLFAILVARLPEE